MALPRLHIITDDAVLARTDFAVHAEAVLAACGSAVMLHLRGHRTSAAVLFALGERLAAAALRSGSQLVVNDRVDIARAVRANGVQLGVSSLPVPEARVLLGAGARIGFSAHATARAVEAVVDGADFVVLGTIFESASHPGRAPAGLDVLRDCALRAGAPVLAIGGVTPDRMRDVAAAGAYGAAVLGAVWHAADPAEAAVACLAACAAAYPEHAVQERSP